MKGTLDDSTRLEIKNQIANYSVQELYQYDPELLSDENENKRFMICDRRLLLDYIRLQKAYDLVNNNRDKKNIDNLKIKAQIIDLVGKL